MASDTAALVEAMGMAMCAYALGGKACPCKERGEFRCLEAYPGYQATVAYNALRDTLVPVVWAVDHPEYDGPVFGTEFTPLTPEEAAEGFTMYALHTLPELKP